MSFLKGMLFLALCPCLVVLSAQAAEFHVAVDGNDTNPGTAQAPFRTLRRARDAVRALQPLREPLDVVIHDGVYYLEATLELGPEDSGTAECPVTWCAAKGAFVVLSGGRKVTGDWGRVDKHRWAVKLDGVALPAASDKAEAYAATPVAWHFRQLFVNGKRAIRARFPNADDEEPFLYAKGGAHDRIECYPDEVRPEWAESPDAQVNIVAGWRFFNQRNDIRSIDAEANLILLGERERHAPIKKDNWYWVEGVQSELNRPGEWYLNPKTGQLLYWPIDEGDPNEEEVIAPYLNRIVYLKGDVNAGTHVEHVRFRGLEFRHTTYTLGHIEARVHTDAAVKFNNARYCRVENCRFENIGGYAVWLHLDSTDNIFVRNTVLQGGGGGFLLTGARFSYMDDTKVYTPGDAAAAVAPLRNRIERNDVGHCGLYRYYGGGVHLDSRPAQTAMMQGNTVVKNYFHDLSRNGIFAFRNQGGNLFAYNRIDNAMLTTLDGGGIHMATMNKLASPTYCTGNVITNIWGMDRTRNGQGKRHIARGIFLDWFTSSMVMRDNLIYNTWLGGYCVLGGNDNLFENNVIVKDPDGCTLAYNWGKSKGLGNTELNNVIAKTGNGPIVDAESGDFRLRDDFDYPDGFVPFDTTLAGLEGMVKADISPEDLTWTGGVLHYSGDRFESVGEWSRKEATGMSGLFQYGYLLAEQDSGAIATFRLPIEKSGIYDVYVYFAERDDLAKRVAVTVRHAHGDAKLSLDQTQSGNWPKLGRWRFSTGADSWVRISTKGASGPVVVDSVGFVLRG